jgi:apolipoprotein D and lipocalin family protein
MRDSIRLPLRRAASALAVVLAASALISCAGAPSTKAIPAVPSFDWKTFEGKWYEIARIPIPIARDWVGTSDTYVARDDGKWTVLYEGFPGGFDAKKQVMKQTLRIEDPAAPGEMLASPLPLVWLPYRLIYWDAAGLVMLVTSATMDSLWIMAKDPLPKPSAYDAAVERARGFGFDVARLEKVPQWP